MDFWIYWIALGVLFIILEMFLGTLDFLAIGIAALLTGLLAYIFHIDMQWWEFTALIFLMASIGAILITRLLILPKIQGENKPEPMSGDAVAGKQLKTSLVNERIVVKYEWNYWNIMSDEIVEEGDIVEVVSMKDNKLKVKKL